MDKKYTEIASGSTARMTSESKLRAAYAQTLSNAEYERGVERILENIQAIKKSMDSQLQSSGQCEKYLNNIGSYLHKLNNHSLREADKQKIHQAIIELPIDLQQHTRVLLNNSYKVVDIIFQLKIKIADEGELPKILAEAIIDKLNRINKLLRVNKQKIKNESDKELLVTFFSSIDKWFVAFKKFNRIDVANAKKIEEVLRKIQQHKIASEMRRPQEFEVFISLRSLFLPEKKRILKEIVPGVALKHFVNASYPLSGRPAPHAFFNSNRISLSDSVVSKLKLEMSAADEPEAKIEPGRTILNTLNIIKNMIAGLSNQTSNIEQVKQQFYILDVLLENRMVKNIGLGGYKQEIEEAMVGIRSEIFHLGQDFYRDKNNQDIFTTICKLDCVCWQDNSDMDEKRKKMLIASLMEEAVVEDTGMDSDIEDDDEVSLGLT